MSSAPMRMQIVDWKKAEARAALNKAFCNYKILPTSCVSFGVPRGARAEQYRSICATGSFLLLNLCAGD